ncbi:dipicolinate synthase subunit B [Solibaculum mannosilyticum]|uniref:dipicolinate synthase subunit B n=1 Tax=Solibaculum mannosilyticum TaxID=2780922 RepID=UPI000C07A266|nr:dipicolinate synthase subunit B [[Clostridium] leptum]
MNNVTVGFAMCGSFCTFSKAIPQMEKLLELGHKVVPIMSQIAYSTDTRFGKAEDFRQHIEELCGRSIIHTIDGAEPIGPKKMLDILVIVPCTGNTMGKLALGITDSPVTMASKSHLRNGSPLVICPATNDGLSASAPNIGKLMNTKNIYFVPMEQDDPQKKPTSLVAKFDMLIPTMEEALLGKQIQPVLWVDGKAVPTENL